MKIPPAVKIGRCTRDYAIDSCAVRTEPSDDGNGDRTFVDLSFSSEYPVLRRPFFGEPFFEVLGHDAGEAELDRLNSKGPVRDEHNGPIVGVTRDAWLENQKGQATVELSRNRDHARTIAADLRDDIIGNVSQAYFPLEYELVKHDEEGPDTYRVTRWEPIHIAFVGEPADPTVGVGRSMDTEADAREVRVVIPERFTRSAGDDRGATPSPTAEQEESRTMPDETPKAPAVDTDAIREEAEATVNEAHDKRIRGILAIRDNMMTRYPDVRNLADEHIRDGKSEKDFQAAVLDFVGSNDPAPQRATIEDMEDPRIGMTDKDVQRYSLLRAAKAWAAKENCYELEVGQDAAKKLREEPRGFAVPYEVFADPNFAPAQRTAVGTATGGSGLKGTVLEAGSFIDRLRERVVLARLGMTILDGLVGDVDIPYMAAGADHYWVGEDTNITDDASTDFDVIQLTPKTIGLAVPVTRRMLLQSTPAVEGLVRNDIIRTAAIEIDRAGIQGGGSNEPTGIIERGIGAPTTALGTDGGDPTWEMVVDLETQVAIDDADMGALSYLTNPKVRGKLKNTVKNTTDASRFIWDSREGDYPLNGYPVAVTNVVPSNLEKNASGTTLSALIFGNFNDVLMGMWGVLDVVADPWTAVAKGGLVLRVFQDLDFHLRHVESFAACEEIVTT